MTNILSLDGGGTWALIQTRALARLYPGMSGHRILSHFDFAFANSGGSLVLGGLLADMSPLEIEAYFTDEAQRRAIYVRSPRLLSWLLRLVGAGSRYSTPAKRDALGKVFGDREFVSVQHPGGRTTCAVIVAFDYVRSRAFLIRSAPSRYFPTVAGLPLADAVHASTTAPVLYYDRPAEFAVTMRFPGIAPAPINMQFWDGGVAGLNNPVAAAVGEALSAGNAARDIAVLSIGTGTVWRSNNPAHRGDPDQLAAHEDSAPLADIRKLAKAVVGDPPDFASTLAHAMTGGVGPVGGETVASTRIIRLNPLVLGDFDGQWCRPAWNVAAARGPDLFRRLQLLDMDASAQDNVADIERLADAWLADRAFNQPVRANFFQGAAGLHAEVGHTRFSAAAAAAAMLGLA